MRFGLKFGLLKADSDSTSNKAIATSAITSVDGTSIKVMTNGVPTDNFNYQDFTLTIDGVSATIGNTITVTGNDFDINGISPTILPGDTNILLSYLASTDANVEDFTDLQVANATTTGTLVHISKAYTTTDGAEVVFETDGDVEETFGPGEITIKYNGSIIPYVGINIVSSSKFAVQVQTQAAATDTITISYNSQTNNLVPFTDYPVENKVVSAAPPPVLDLDGDGKPDTVLYDANGILVTEDDLLEENPLDENEDEKNEDVTISEEELDESGIEELEELKEEEGRREKGEGRREKGDCKKP